MSFLVVQLAGALLRERKGRREDEREGEGGRVEGKGVEGREGKWVKGREGCG